MAFGAGQFQYTLFCDCISKLSWLPRKVFELHRDPTAVVRTVCLLFSAALMRLNVGPLKYDLF